MHSRTRKYRKSFQNYQQAIQNHLNDDFLVYQYLTQNKLTGNNIDEYSKLFNSLLVTKNDKIKKYQSLKVHFDHMTDEQDGSYLQKSNIQSWEGNKDQFCNQFDQILVKTSTQMEVKNTLWKQIVQVKKSLNLLKGDIGHLIGRNESANMLESKISKVKIVADDQLKRVCSAFGKDKDQLKIRGDMQKRFTKKLKNVSMFEDSTLKRLKTTYIDTMSKKRQIHDRLNYIQKIGASINESDQKQRLKNENNYKILELYKNFMKLESLINKVCETEIHYFTKPGEMHQFVNWLRNNEQTRQQNPFTSRNRIKSKKSIFNEINSQDLEIITKVNLNHFEQIFIQQHKRITQEIEKKVSQYDLEMKRTQQMIIKLDSYQQEMQKLKINLYKQIGLKYIFTNQMREEHTKKLKHFINALKTIFTLLEYVQKNLNYSSGIHQMRKKPSNSSSQYFANKDSYSCKKSSFETFNITINPISQNKLNQQPNTLVWLTKNYISQLYKTYFELFKQDQSQQRLEQISSEIYFHLQSDAYMWLHEIKQIVVNGKIVKIPQYHHIQKDQIKGHKENLKMRESRLSMMISPKTVKQIQEEQINEVKQQNQFYRQAYVKHHTEHQQNPQHFSHIGSPFLSKNRHINMSNSKNRTSDNTLSSQSRINLVNIKKLKHTTEHSFQQAQRIQLLHNVDKDYYKMLKSTLTMEKQNTRKNYSFLRTFKRAKFSARDEILQQKRFECSFSMLFAGKKNQLAKKKLQDESKKSTFFKNGNLQRRLSKLGEPIKQNESSKMIKFSESCVSFSDGMNDLKQNVRRIKQNSSNQIKRISKRNLSIEMRDIMNLI